MATEESNAAEFQEKTGLKRKLTGPPRLLLGKTRSPGQDEKKSRKHRRHEDEDDGGTPADAAKDERSAEVDKQTTPERPEPVLITEHDEGPCTDLQDEHLETTSHLEDNKKKRQRRRSKAGKTIRRMFSCVRRRKESGTKDAEDAEVNTHHGEHNSTQDQEDFLTRSGDSFRTRREQEPVKKVSSRRTFKARMWNIFKKRSCKQECEEEGRYNGNFMEIASETSVRRRSGAAEPPGVDEQMEESTGIDEDETGIHEENSFRSQDPKNAVMEMISLNAEVLSVHEHPSDSHISCLVDEEQPKLQISAAPQMSAVESNSHLEDSRMSPEDPDPVEKANGFKCKPVILIEDVHSSDEESHDLFENTAPQYGTLSPPAVLNGSWCTIKTPDTRISEILLAQTALSLVRAAIGGAVEQLSSELQSRQVDQDRV